MLDSANTFSLDTITVYNDKLVYGVSMSRGTDSGMLYIDVETFGFLKITMERKIGDKSKPYYEEHTINKSGKWRRIWFRFLSSLTNTTINCIQGACMNQNSMKHMIRPVS